MSGPYRKGRAPRFGGGAVRVASGMSISRVLGFLREMALAYFLGVGPHADVFRTALRGPNLLQNLLGEQTLSASFIPIYSRMIATGREREAGRFAGAVFGLLLAIAGTVSALGVLFARPIVAVLAPGYLRDVTDVTSAVGAPVDRFTLAVTAVRIIFPMTALLVLSAWTLGVLNSHRRFFLPYCAPALWNAAIIGVLAWKAAELGWSPWQTSASSISEAMKGDLLLAACVGALIGGGLQFLIQLPSALRVMRGFRPRLSVKVDGVRDAVAAFAPLAAGRGAVQLSGYLDFFLASFLIPGALSALGWAQTLYLLPISLFGMSVAAAELPELSRQSPDGSTPEAAHRLQASVRQMAFLTIPTMVGYLSFGYLLVGGLFRRGEFTVEANLLVYLVLSGYTLGLLASNTSRLMNNMFYAVGDTKLPARVAVERVLLSAVLGTVLMVWLDRWPVDFVSLAPGGGETGQRLFLGAVGLSLGAAVGSWYELWRLKGGMLARMNTRLHLWQDGRAQFGLALIAAVPGFGLWWLVRSWPLLSQAAIVTVVYAATYLALSSRRRDAGLSRWLGR